MLRRHIHCLIIAILLSILSVTATYHFIRPSIHRLVHPEYGWYFSISAKQGFIEQRGVDYYLVLDYPSKKILAMADRPHKLTDTFTFTELVNSWLHIFLDNAPSGAIIGEMQTPEGPKLYKALIEVLAPRIVNEETIEFSINPLGNTELKNDVEIDNISLNLSENWKDTTELPKHLVQVD